MTDILSLTKKYKFDIHIIKNIKSNKKKKAKNLIFFSSKFNLQNDSSHDKV